MTVESRNGPPAEPVTKEREHANAIGSESRGTPPWRWLLVIVPLLVIAVTGVHLIGRLAPAFQQALREVRFEPSDRIEPEHAPGEASEERSSEPEETGINVEDLLKALRGPAEEEGARPRPPADLPLRPVDLGPAAGDAAQTGFDGRRVVALLGEANVEDGARLFRMCSPCHTDEKGASSPIGPNLWGIVGRAKAAAPDFSYSNALKSKGGTWSYEDLAEFLHEPRTFAPGTKMAFRGIADSAKIANLIAYLRTRSDNSLPLAR